MVRLGMVLLIMLGWGCAMSRPAQDPGQPRMLFGDHGSQILEYPDGRVVNLSNGHQGRRQGAYIQDLNTGALHFTYGSFVEEREPR